MKERKAPRQQVKLDPESEAWKAIPWRKLEQHVYRIQKRIYRASQHGNTRKVQKLQKLLMKSQAARLLAVRRVTQDNQGKKTAGVDGVKSVHPKQRFAMGAAIHPTRWKNQKSRPVRRVWIPKPGKMENRPLGIPVMSERAQQALVKSALEPEWEARFEPNSYGFRPGRSCHDAIGAIFNEIRYQPKFVLDADIKGCFDAINQKELLKKLHTYPQMRQTLKNWLKAGVLDNGIFTPTESGTPQGGVISPLLANIALHGMEEAIAQGYRKRAEPALIRYADDFLIFHPDKDELEKATQRITDWLKNMGLVLSPKKTRVTHTLDPYEGNVGFDFLGFSIRQYRVGKTHTAKAPYGKPLGFKTIIKPSKDAIKRHTQEIRQRIHQLSTASQEKLIRALNPVIRGWANYYRFVPSSMVFHWYEHNVYVQLMQWARRKHPTRGKKWITKAYWRTKEKRHWVFMTPEGVELRSHSQTPLARHRKVRGRASPYDGNLIYWSQRLKEHPLMQGPKARLLQLQKGQCPRCGLHFRDGDLLEIDHIVPTTLGGKKTLDNKWVYHRHCHDEKTAEDLARIRAWKAAGITNT
jgi:RNA-directed DNA polymerase